MSFQTVNNAIFPFSFFLCLTYIWILSQAQNQQFAAVFNLDDFKGNRLYFFIKWTVRYCAICDFRTGFIES